MEYPKVDLEKKHKGMAEGIPRPTEGLPREDSGTGHIPVALPEEKDLDHPEHGQKANERKDYRTTDVGKGPKVGRPEDCHRQIPADAKLIHQQDAQDLSKKLPSGTSEERKFESSAPINKETITKASKENQDKVMTEGLVEKAAKINEEKLGEGDKYKETGLPARVDDKSAPISDNNVAPNVNFAANVPGMPYDPKNAAQQGTGTTYNNTEDAAKVGLSSHVEKSQPDHKELPTKASKPADDKTLTEKISEKASEAKDYVDRKITPSKDKTADQHLADAGEKIEDAGERLKSAVKPESMKTTGEKASDVARDVKDATKEKINEAAAYVKDKTS